MTPNTQQPTDDIRKGEPGKSPEHPTGLTEKQLFLLIMVLAAGIRLYGLGGKQLWVDEIIQAIHATADSLAAILQGVKTEIGTGPLDHLLQNIFIQVFGRSEWVFRAHACLFGILTVALVYVLARRLFSARVARYAALLYALYPLHHHYSQEGRPYALLVLLTVLSFVMLVRVWHHPRFVVFSGYVLTLTALFHTNYLGLLVPVVHGAILLGLRRETPLAGQSRSTSGWRWMVIRLGMAWCLAAVLFLQWLLYAFRTTAGTTAETFNAMLVYRLFHELGDRNLPLALLLLGLAVWGWHCLRRSGQRGAAALLGLWAALPVPLVLLLIVVRDYFFAIRQILLITPALYILAAYGITLLGASLRQPWCRRLPGMMLAVMALLSVTTIVLHLPDRRMDLRGASRYLQRTVRPSDLVVAPRLASLLEFYAPELPFVTLPEGEDRLSVPAVPRRIWFVESSYTTTRGRQWLSRRIGAGAVKRAIGFRKLHVYELVPATATTVR